MRRSIIASMRSSRSRERPTSSGFGGRCARVKRRPERPTRTRLTTSWDPPPVTALGSPRRGTDRRGDSAFGGAPFCNRGGATPASRRSAGGSALADHDVAVERAQLDVAAAAADRVDASRAASADLPGRRAIAALLHARRSFCALRTRNPCNTSPCWLVTSKSAARFAGSATSTSPLNDVNDIGLVAGRPTRTSPARRRSSSS